MAKISSFGGAQEFLNLDFPCSMVWNNQPFPSLWHSMIAGMTTNKDLRNALSDNQFIMNPQIIADLWSQVEDLHEYRMQVVEMVFNKYAPFSLLNSLLAYTTDEDEFIYQADPSRVVGITTQLIRKGRSLPEVLQALGLQA